METGELPDALLLWTTAVFRISATSGPGWLVPLCWLQPPLTLEESRQLEVLSGPWDSLQVTNAEYQAAEALLKDFHFRYQMNLLWFWIYAPFVLLVVLILVGLVPLMLHLCCRYSRYKQTIAFLEGPRRQQSFDRRHTEAEHIAETSFHLGEASKITESMAIWHISAREFKFLGIWEVFPLVQVMQRPKHRIRGVLQKLFKDSKPLLVIALFMIYSDLLLMLWQVLDCIEPLEGDVGLRIASSPDLECYKAHGARKNVFIFALLSGLGFGIFVPMYVFFSIHSSPFRHFRKHRFQRAWGFLITGYQFEYGAWEALVFCRKGISVLVAIAYIHTELRVMFLLMVSASFSLAHIKVQPFDNKFNEVLDKHEGRHLCFWTTISLGILFFKLVGQNLLGAIAWLTTIVMLGLHIAFLLAAVINVAIHWRLTFVSRAVQRALNRQQMSHAYTVVKDAILNVEERASSIAHETVAGFQHAVHAADHAFVALTRQAVPACDADRAIILNNEMGIPGLLARTLMRNTDKKKGYLQVIPEKMWMVLHGRPRLKEEMNTKIEQYAVMSSTSHSMAVYDKPDEDLRRYLVNILMEAFEYIVVTQGLSTFSCSVLEFIICAGFAFDSTGLLAKPGSSARPVITTASDDSSEFNIKHVQSAVNAEAQALQMPDIVAHMLDPSIFEQTLSLPDFHLNLTRLTTRSDSELREWLDVFEVEWGRRRSERLCGVPGGSHKSEPHVPFRPVYHNDVEVQTMVCELAERPHFTPCQANWARLVQLQLHVVFEQASLKPMTAALARNRQRRQTKHEELQRLKERALCRTDDSGRRVQ